MAKICIIVKVDRSCDMASVNVDQRHSYLPDHILKGGMVGNFWDFHPGCHGIRQFGEFSGFNDLTRALKNEISKLGHEPIVVRSEVPWTKF